MVPPSHPVVFFDGECPFCNRWAWRMRALDRHSRLRFAPLQGETARLLLPAELRPEGRPGTMVFWVPQPPAMHLRSQAALRAFTLTGSWVSPFTRLLLLFPTSWGDWVYGLIERSRERGKGTTCPLPEPADIAALLP